MTIDIQDNVDAIVSELVNASDNDDSLAYWDQYKLLEKICTDNQRSDNDHPYQWEALGDFTVDDNAALKIYRKALKLAQKKSLNDYLASLNFAMAERHKELDDLAMACQLAKQAVELSATVDDEELRQDINEFLFAISDGVS